MKLDILRWKVEELSLVYLSLPFIRALVSTPVTPCKASSSLSLLSLSSHCSLLTAWKTPRHWSPWIHDEQLSFLYIQFKTIGIHVSFNFLHLDFEFQLVPELVFVQPQLVVIVIRIATDEGVPILQFHNIIKENDKKEGAGHTALEHPHIDVLGWRFCSIDVTELRSSSEIALDEFDGILRKSV